LFINTNTGVSVCYSGHQFKKKKIVCAHVFLTVYASLLIKYDYMYQYGTHPRWPLMLGQVKTGIIKIVTPTDLTYCFISNVVFMVLSLLSGDFRKGAKI
jgi:hypothetical protein